MFLILYSMILSSIITPQNSIHVLNKLQNTYQKSGYVNAKFTQKVLKRFGHKSEESGEFYLDKKGRVFWMYKNKDPQKRKFFIYDGDKAYYYEPALAQVTVFDEFIENPLSLALHFLLGRGDYIKNFEPQTCKKYCDISDPKNLVITLKPKDNMINIKYIILYIDPQKYYIKQILLVESDQKKIEYHFYDIQLGNKAKVSEDYFNFNIPEGVHILNYKDIQKKLDQDI